MRKRFKSRKTIQKKYVFVLLFAFSLWLIYWMISFLFHQKFFSSNEDYMQLLLSDIRPKEKRGLYTKIVDDYLQISIKNPITLMKKSCGLEEETIFHITSSDEFLESFESEYIEDPSPEEVLKPKVYLYNTHQTEAYAYRKQEEYNVIPNVMMSSYILRENLNKLGIPTIVETSNMKEILNAHAWDYASSYQASRFLVKDALEKYDTLSLIIDIHRDAIAKGASTIEENGKKYAKVLFVVGKEYKTYQENLKLSNALHEKIKEKYPHLSRGVLIKGGAGVNGVYNQDLKSNIILLECGGNENTMEEVKNTLEVIAEVIREYIGD